MLKVSVVVAVYNPGADIDKLLESLDAQTMPQSDFEVVFADDDSTDGTRERLQEWARTRQHVQVIHNTPNSGWPGKPRNLGIEHANGEFVFFADNDDKFTPNALEWMYDYAQANDSDVVVPKEVGVGPARGVTGPVYRENIPDAKLGRDPILGILTPHKLIRTSLLRDNDIRFPEGKVRLEDHYVVTAAYFAAKKVSVLADRLCYYWMRRESGGQNAQFSSVDPAVYYDGVARALEVVEANTGPGDFRYKLYSHWYDTKMLARLSNGLLARSPASRRRLVAALRDVSDRFGLDERMLPHLGAGGRARALLLQHGTVDDLCTLAEVNRVTTRVDVREFEWREDGKLALSLYAEFVYADSKEPIRLRSEGGRSYWDVHELGVALDPIDVTDKVGDGALDVLATDRGTHEMSYLVSASRPVTGTDRIAATTDVVLDPAELFRGKPVGSIIDLHTRCHALGWSSVVRVPASAVPGLPRDGWSPDYGRVRAYPTQTYEKLSLRLMSRRPPRHGRLMRAGSPRIERYARGALRRLRRAAGRVRRRVRARLGR